MCHCGQPVVVNASPREYWEHFNQSLAFGYCEACALVRCDAFPGACRAPTSPVARSGKDNE